MTSLQARLAAADKVRIRSKRKAGTFIFCSALLLILIIAITAFVYFSADSERMIHIAQNALLMEWRIVCFGGLACFIYFIYRGIYPAPNPFYCKLLPEILADIYAPFNHQIQTFPPFFRVPARRFRVADTYGTITVQTPKCEIVLGYFIKATSKSANFSNDDRPYRSWLELEQHLEIELYPAQDRPFPQVNFFMSNHPKRPENAGFDDIFDFEGSLPAVLKTVEPTMLEIESLMNDIATSTQSGTFSPLHINYSPEKISLKIGCFPILAWRDSRHINDEQMLQSKEWLDMLFERLPWLIP